MMMIEPVHVQDDLAQVLGRNIRDDKVVVVQERKDGIEEKAAHLDFLRHVGSSWLTKWARHEAVWRVAYHVGVQHARLPVPD